MNRWIRQALHVRALWRRVPTVYGWQVLHLLLADGQPEDFAEPGPGADRDGHVDAAPQVRALGARV